MAPRSYSTPIPTAGAPASPPGSQPRPDVDLPWSDQFFGRLGLVLGVAYRSAAAITDGSTPRGDECLVQLPSAVTGSGILPVERSRIVVSDGVADRISTALGAQPDLMAKQPIWTGH